jgi:hypothetical protein
MGTDDNEHWNIPGISYMFGVCDTIKLSAKCLIGSVGLYVQKSAF